MVSIADPYDLVLRDVILRSIEHEIGDIRPRDFETKTGQVALSHAVLSGVRLVCKLGGRSIVHSSSLSPKIRSMADASATVPGKNNRPRK